MPTAKDTLFTYRVGKVENELFFLSEFQKGRYVNSETIDKKWYGQDALYGMHTFCSVNAYLLGRNALFNIIIWNTQM